MSGDDLKGCFVPVFLKPHGDFNKIDLTHSLKEDGFCISGKTSILLLFPDGSLGFLALLILKKKMLGVENVHVSVGESIIFIRC